MKNSPLTTFLLAVLALSTVLSVIFCVMYVSSTRQLRMLQGQMTFINGRTSAITSLANDTLEYSKRNPAIDPILESFNIKPPRTAPSSTNVNAPGRK